MRQSSLSKSIQVLCPLNARVYGHQSKICGGSGAPAVDLDSCIAKKQIAILEKKLLELKLQLDGAAQKTEWWLASYQDSCSAIATAYAAAIIGPKK